MSKARMKKFLTLILIAAFSALSVSAQYRNADAYQQLYDSEPVAAMKVHVRELSSVDLGGRKAGSEGERQAAEYVGKTLKDYGVDILGPVDGEIFGIKTENGDTLTSRNVVGFVQGYDSELRNQYIVIGARLDNLGIMTMTVDGKPVDRIYYGANGNASGLAMMLELARMIQTNSILFRRSILFVAFGASKETYAGSWYFLNRSFKDTPLIDAMINLDMLGTGYNGFYAYTASNADLNALLRTQTGELQPILPELTAQEPYPSDHRAFYSKQIPSVLFTTGRYPQHNTDKDTQSIIDFPQMERELEYIFNFTVALANTDMKLAFNPSDVDDSVSQEDVVQYFDCDQRPQFFGSSDLRHFLKEWVYQYLKYPSAALQHGIQGTVMVEFIIEKDGKISNVRVAKGVSEELDAEALKVVQASPKWKPGKVSGNKVRSSVTVPVEFRLEKKSGKSSFGIKK
jgi:TonB family protein